MQNPLKAQHFENTESKVLLLNPFGNHYDSNFNETEKLAPCI